jgi:6-pyruvoyltetrahydropterin/6-carboxytetrahydropterin synthase
MYEIRVHALFSAVHQLRLGDGRLEPLHGHDWRAEAVFRGPDLDDSGLLVDFVAAEAGLREVVAALHHSNLNEAPMLAGLNPTAEHVARRIFEELQARLGQTYPLSAVYVREAPGCVAGFTVS